jgi:hypothetical protein
MSSSEVGWAGVWLPCRGELACRRPDVLRLILWYRTAPQVMVISSEGLFQAYNIDLEAGGECSLMKEFSSVQPTSLCDD